MLRFHILLLLFLIMNSSLFSQNLKNYRWENRILLLCDRQEDLIRSKKQIDMFSSFRGELKERKLLFRVFDGKALRDQDFQVIEKEVEPDRWKDFEGVLLLGLDGGIKLKSEFFVRPEGIFKLIDSMPMRQAEMKRKNSQ